ncbi:hypothetical protein [Paracoccus liaowanqingii]|nr:hypothetical protein [Paracoccus liaowanqingii]
MDYILSTDLSEREIYVIGSIVSQWGFIENEIFEQTLLSFEEEADLPKSMIANAQFSTILDLWLERVAEKQGPSKKEVLVGIYNKIKSLSEFRQAVVHSRWEWNPSSRDEITAIRVHKKTVKSVKFTFEDLADFSNSLGKIRYSIRYPGGLEDRVEEMNRIGGHLSREFWEAITPPKS